MTNKIYEIAILGAGASGLFCAGCLPNKDKIIIDHNERAGLKVLASGGGNCNFSNSNISAKNYFSQNKNFCISALAGFKPQDFLALLKANKIDFEHRPTGQYFAKSSKDILDFLLSRINKNNTFFAFNTQIKEVRFLDDTFIIDCHDKVYYSKKVIIALGGKSYSKLGASDKALKIAKSFNLNTFAFKPALVGIIFDDVLKNKFSHLSGLSIFARVSCGKNTCEDSLLFTHEGLSGPSIFKLSLYGFLDQVKINFAPKIDVLNFLKTNKNSTKKVANLCEEFLPKKLSHTLLDCFDKTLADSTKQDLQTIARTLQDFTFTPKSTCGFDKAEVSVGGVDTQNLSSKNMECLTQKGLYFIGESVDVTGELGGYNLHWCFASAWAVAKNIDA